jgi:hypothetical protein
VRPFNPFVLLVLLVAQSAPTRAADLNGAWAVDTASCDVVTVIS